MDADGGLTLPEYVHELGNIAKDLHRLGDKEGACDALDAALIAVIDALDPERAGQGLRFVPMGMPMDGMIDLPTVSVPRTPQADDFSAVYDLLKNDTSFTDEETECS